MQSFLDFLSIPWILSAEQRILLILEDFSFNFLENLNAQLNFVKHMIWKLLACNARRYSQSLSAKMATLGLLKIKISWNKDYDVIISIHDLVNKILLLDSNYILNVVMLPF